MKADGTVYRRGDKILSHEKWGEANYDSGGASMIMETLTSLKNTLEEVFAAATYPSQNLA